MYNLDVKADIARLHNDGMSFNDIAKYLCDKYGIKASRQAVCSQYHRIMGDPFLNTYENIEKSYIINDILNYKVIGIRNKDIIKIIDNEHVKPKYISDIVESSKNKLVELHNKKVELTTQCMTNNLLKDNIIANLQYKGIKPTSEKINEFFKEAIENIINQSINSIVLRLNSKLCIDKRLEKYIEHRYNVNITIR